MESIYARSSYSAVATMLAELDLADTTNYGMMMIGWKANYSSHVLKVHPVSLALQIFQVK